MLNDNERRKLNMFQGESAFMDENAADFPADSPGGRAAAAHAALISEIQLMATRKFTGINEMRRQIELRRRALGRIRSRLIRIGSVARALDDQIPGIEQKFRIPRNRNDQNVLAAARSFAAEAVAFQTVMAEWLGHGFIDELLSDVAEAEQNGTAADMARDQKAEARGDLRDAVRRGMRNSQAMRAAVLIKYRDNPGKLEAWKAASHLEHPPHHEPRQPPVT